MSDAVVVMGGAHVRGGKLHRRMLRMCSGCLLVWVDVGAGGVALCCTPAQLALAFS